MQDLYTVIIRPVVTEKTSICQSDSQYVFFVSPDANKIIVKEAVETLYNTKVSSVNMIPVRKKTRMIGRNKVHTKRRAQKKAVVTLKKGKTIDVNKVQKENK